MRTVYLGTSEFAATVLRIVAASRHRPSLVVTRPDAPRGRGRKLAPPPVAEAARELGIELDQPADVNAEDARAQIAAHDPGAVLVCAFGALLKEPLLSEHELLNVHPSLLPRWRGAAPIERTIMAGDEETGVCIMRVTAGWDSGPLCATHREPVAGRDYGALGAALAEAGGHLLVAALDGPRTFAEQDESQVTYADKITAQDRTLDLAAPPDVNERIVRALHPHIGARIALADGSFLGVHEARVAGGRLELVTVQPPGGRPMSYGDYVRGHGEPSFA